MTFLPGIICWYLGSAVIYAEKAVVLFRAVSWQSVRLLDVRRNKEPRRRKNMKVRKTDHTVGGYFLPLTHEVCSILLSHHPSLQHQECVQGL